MVHPKKLSVLLVVVSVTGWLLLWTEHGGKWTAVAVLLLLLLGCGFAVARIPRQGTTSPYRFLLPGLWIALGITILMIMATAR